MSRGLASAVLRELYATTTGEAFLLLATVSHETMAEPWRIVRNTAPIQSRGATFEPFPFDFTLPDDLADRPPEMQFVVDNVLLPMGAVVRSITTPADLLVELIAASKPDEVLARVEGLRLRSVEWNASTMTFRAALEDVLNARFPADVFAPDEYAGIF